MSTPPKNVKAKLSAEQKKARKLKRDHIRSARAVFRNSGFERASEIAEKNIEFEGQAGEFDDAFVYENVILLLEYTTSQGADVTDHLKKKKVLFRKIVDNRPGFLRYLRQRFSSFHDRLGSLYHEDTFILRIVYCSRNDFDAAVKHNVNEPAYLDYPILKYFEKISSAVKISCQHELFQFLDIDPVEVGRAGIFNKEGAEPYSGSILPEAASGFPQGYKVVSFYADASALLERAFVLRRNGWRSSFEAYQRMLLPSKIEAIRTKLRERGQVAVNNVIVTLPPDVHPIDAKGKTTDTAAIRKAEPIMISLPLRANSIGLIDGQHRLYAYYRSKDDDPKIAILRHQQNLLVTGIIYPNSLSDSERERFEAELFLSINSHQTSAQAELRQEIEVLLNPFGPTAIAKQVMQELSATSPLSGHVETYFYDKGKLKTSSIVSYGLGPLLKFTGDDTLFKIFSHPEKEAIITRESDVALREYIKFSTTRISIFLSAVKANVGAARWTTDRGIRERILTVTYVNAFLITLRRLIENGGSLTFDHLKRDLSGIETFDFKAFHSSQYNRMADAIYEAHFT